MSQINGAILLGQPVFILETYLNVWYEEETNFPWLVWLAWRTLLYESLCTIKGYPGRMDGYYFSFDLFMTWNLDFAMIIFTCTLLIGFDQCYECILNDISTLAFGLHDVVQF